MTNKAGKLEERLEKRYDQLQAERIAKELKEGPFRERVEAIFKAPLRTTQDFWCDTCKRDCTGTGYRRVCTVREWGPTAWFVGYCPEGHKMLRWITDKDSDPYYYRSELLQRQRLEMMDDFITPDDPRFKILYPEKWKELQQPKK